MRGYEEEGSTLTPFDMVVMNDRDRFHLVIDTLDRLLQTGARGLYLKQQLKDKLYIDAYGEDLTKTRNREWAVPKQGQVDMNAPES